MLSQIFWTVQNDKYVSGEFWQLFKPCSSSSGRMSAPIDHSKEFMWDTVSATKAFKRMCSLSSPRERTGFFRSEHCVFVLTGFITDNIVCSSLLRLHIAVHIKPRGSHRAVFVLLCFSFQFAMSYWQTWFALSWGLRTECWNSLQTQKLLLTTFWTNV